MAAPRCLALLALMALAITGANAADITKYIAAETVNWDVAPSGMNLCKNTTLEGSSEQATWTTNGAGRVLKKARFIEYTDAELKTPVVRPAEEEHLALLGPLLRVVPGDTITIHFANRVNFPLRLDPAGLAVLPTAGEPDSLGAVADPGENVTYTWSVPEAAAPGPEEPSSTKFYMYRSSLDPGASDNAGLIGAILIGRDSTAFNSGRDVITVLQIVDENASPYLEANLAGRTPEELGVAEADLEEGLLRHSINGRLFCNLEGLRAVQGEETRWHFGVIGSEADVHVAHLHANTWLEADGHRADQVAIIAGSTRSVLLDVRTPGNWLMHCHINDHITAGMLAIYTVDPAPEGTAIAAEPLDGTVRKYFVAAEEVEWNYAPLDGNACAGAMQAAAAEEASTGNAIASLPSLTQPGTGARPTVPFTEDELVFVGNMTGRVGSKYMKALYFEYTDATFTKKKERTDSERFLGLAGPLLRGEVGDTMEVVFLNRLTNHHASLHPHGVNYNKSSEGAPYADGSGPLDRVDDAVAPGVNVTYTWAIPESAGPGPADPSTVAWLYHSHAAEVAGPYAGLVGALIVGRAGAFSRRDDGSLGHATDVDVETLAIFAVFNERESYLWPRNAAAVLKRDSVVLGEEANGKRKSRASVEREDEGDVESDLMHSINGYVYCNAPELRVQRGQTMRLHVITIGSEVDLHSPTVEGASLTSRRQTGPAIVALAGSMNTADIIVNGAPGPALMQCRVADHIAAGMQALVRIVDDAPTFETRAAPATADDGAISVQQDLQDAATGVTRPYFIQAEETMWDFVPLGENYCAPGGPQPFTEDQLVFVGSSPSTIGSKYKKAVYRRYSSDSFATAVPSPSTHGLQGPLLAAEVGEVLEITYKNTLKFPANLRLDGGFVPTVDSANPALPVAPGQAVTYRLLVPAAAGPSANDVNTVAYGYGSSVDYIGHPMAGLVGMALIGSRGAFADADPSNMPTEPVPAGTGGVLPLIAAIFNENASPYLPENAKPLDLTTADMESEDFFESNLLHSLSGLLYCNNRINVTAGSGPLRVAVLALGSETDLHSILVAGQVIKGAPATMARGSLEPLLPAVTMTADVAAPLAEGTWSIVCAIHDHVEAGMEALLTVQGDGSNGDARTAPLAVGAPMASGAARTGLAWAAAAAALLHLLAALL